MRYIDIYTYTYNRVLFSLKKIKKRKILPFPTWMRVIDITLSEISHTQKDEYP